MTLFVGIVAVDGVYSSAHEVRVALDGLKKQNKDAVLWLSDIAKNHAGRWTVNVIVNAVGITVLRDSGLQIDTSRVMRPKVVPHGRDPARLFLPLNSFGINERYVVVADINARIKQFLASGLFHSCGFSVSTEFDMKGRYKAIICVSADGKQCAKLSALFLSWLKLHNWRVKGHESYKVAVQFSK